MNPISSFNTMKSGQYCQNQKSNLHFNAGSSFISKEVSRVGRDLLDLSSNAAKKSDIREATRQRMKENDPRKIRAELNKVRPGEREKVDVREIRKKITEQRDRKLRPELYES